MAYKKKTWREKMRDRPNLPKVLRLEPNFPCGPALVKMGGKKGDKVVITQPHEVEDLMKKVPRGKVVTLKEICQKLAKKHKTDYCCTLTTGIFVSQAANATEDDRKEGKKRLTPYWRTLKMEGELNPKYPGGVKVQKKLLEKERIKVEQRGKRFFVEDYKKKLINL